MQLQMSVVDAPRGTEETVEVRAEPRHTAAQLAEAIGRTPATVLHVDGRPVAPEHPIGLPPLLDGCTVVTGADGVDVTKAIGAAPLRLVTTSGPDTGRTLVLAPGRHVIGRGEMASLRLSDETLSRAHLALVVDRDGVRVQELDTTNGTLVDGEPLPPPGVQLRVGSRLAAGRTTFLLDAPRSRPSRRRPTGEGTVTVNPTPHIPPAADPVRITVPPEPSAPARRRIPWLMVALPLPFAAVLALVFGPRMLLFGLLSPLLAIGSTLSDRSSGRRDHREALRQWARERASAGEELTRALAAERRERLRAAPDATTLLDAARGRSPRLWERRRDDGAHLDLRLGLGSLPARVEVDHGGGRRSHPVLDEIPLAVDLDEVGVLGVAGAPRERAAVVRHLLGQLVTLHSHLDVELSITTTDEGGYSPFVGLVHLRGHEADPGSTRITTDDDGAAVHFAVHAELVRERARHRHGVGGTTPSAHVLVVDDAPRWRVDPGLRTVLAHGREHRVLVIAVADDVAGLPHECGAVARLDGSRLTLEVAGTAAAHGVLDGVGSEWCHRLAAALMPLRDATPGSTGGTLPRATRLVDLLALDPEDPTAIRQTWSSRSGDEVVDLEVVVGMGSEGPFALDLRRDGPHALVAGTTGSGKSEFLQSWVAALAARLSPEEISFVLVDYKGGAAFAACADLPHTVGMLTDLDPEQSERALRSLDAELARRERILVASGAKDIDDHRGEPLPRLVIVIDEFRMLAEEQPGALAHLMRIAAIGRSLGVHLVLATQRPGGIVSADIRANVNLRIALRVRDRVDSEDVLGGPEAVSLPEDVPGRALARTGGAPARTFQTGRVAGHAVSATDGVLVRRPGIDWPTPSSPTDPGPTDLARLANTLVRVADDLGIAPPHRPWLPPLDECIPAADIPGRLGATGAPFGVVDRPDLQQQGPLEWSPSDGHWMVPGGPGTGRTTSIASVVTAAASRWGPDRLHVHVLGDGSSLLTGLSDLPHVGTVLDGQDGPALHRFLGHLDAELADRRARLRTSGHGSLDAWWAAHTAEPVGPAPPPHLMLAIDGWGRIVGPAGSDPGGAAEALEMLLRDGTAAGVRAVVTGGRELLSGKVSSLMSHRLVLHLADRGDASLAGVSPAVSAERAVPGRAHHVPGGHAVQVALPGDVVAPSRPETSTGEAATPWRVVPLPDEVPLDALPDPAGEQATIGIGGCGTDPVVWETPGARRLLVCGPPRSGRTTTLATLARRALQQGHPVALVGGADLATDAGLESCTRVDPEDREGLIALRRRHPDLAVVVDDADRVEDAPVADVLSEITRRADADRGLVLVSTTTQLAATRVRGLVAEVARSRAGVLLQPGTRGDGDALGLRVPPLPRVPGRGYLIAHGRAEEVQVAQA